MPEALCAAQLDPERVLDPGRFLDYERSVRRSRLVDELAARIDRPGLRVCDVGGASGVFLHELRAHAPYDFAGTILELSDAYREQVVDPELHFVRASVLDSQLPDASFDCIVFRHVLHHLVGETVAETLSLQRHALGEMLRLLAPGGVLLFEEEVNRVRSFSRAVYYLSRFASRRRLRWRYFEAGRVVVSFMMPAEIEDALGQVAQAQPLRVEARDYRARDMGLRWKLTLLMADVGNVFYAIRKLPAG